MTLFELHWLNARRAVAPNTSVLRTASLQTEGFHHDPRNYNARSLLRPRLVSILPENNVSDAANSFDLGASREYLGHADGLLQWSVVRFQRRSHRYSPHLEKLTQDNNQSHPERILNGHSLHRDVTYARVA
jgi:hypothetical protein